MVHVQDPAADFSSAAAPASFSAKDAAPQQVYILYTAPRQLLCPLQPCLLAGPHALLCFV